MTNEEIDALVAQHVMHWERLEVDYFGTKYETPRQKELEQWITDVGIESVGDYWINVETKFWMTVYGWQGWQPTRSIAQAWQIVAKFEREGHDVHISTGVKGWRCIIAMDENKDYTGYGDTAPRAICLAALKAAGQ